MSRKIPYFSPKYALFPRHTPPPPFPPFSSPLTIPFPLRSALLHFLLRARPGLHHPLPLSCSFSIQSIFHRRCAADPSSSISTSMDAGSINRVDPCHAARAAVASRSKKQVAKGEGNGLQETKTCTGRKQKAGRKGKGVRRWNAADRKGAEPEEQNALPRRGAERK